MGVSKVIINGVTRIDLTQDTVASNNLLSGETATGADGEAVVGAIASKASTDLTVSGATVTAPAGFYSAAASKTVASGTAGTPSASKSTVSNHSVSVTPSVTNTTGYITGGTKTGTAVTVTAAELESGTKTITENGTGISVSGYSMVDVNVSETYTVTLKNSGNSKLFVKYPSNINGTKYYTAGDTITFHAGEELACYAEGEGGGEVTVDGERVIFSGSYASYRYTLPAMDIDVTFGTNSTSGIPQVAITTNSGGVTVEPLNVTQNGTYTAPEGTAYSPVTVAVEGGSASAEAKDVNFFDYDGTIVYSYTPAEFAELTEMPANPSHARLIALGWNWTLADAKAEVATNKRLNIGQMYTTVSGATEIDVTIPATNLSPYLGCAISGSVVIDWGDNTATTTVTGSSTTTLIFTQHTYATSGNYTIKLTPSDTSSLYFRGTSTSYYGILSPTNALTGSDGTYQFSVTGFYEGNRTYLSNYALAGCPGLRVVTLTPGATMGSYCFYTCRSLRHITLPGKDEHNYSMTQINSYVFQYCMALQSVSIPKSVKTLSQSCFSNCYALESITLHEGLTTINNTAFIAVYALHRLDIPSTVTTLQSAGSTSSIRTISLPSSVTSAGSLSFENCCQLTTVVFPTNWPAGIPSFNNCVALTSITMPEQASGQCGGFSNCYALESIVIPEGTTTLESNTFQNCYNLTSITLPSTLTAIPTYAFSANHRLETITIPASVTSIAANAFFNLRSIKAIHFLPETPPTLAASIKDNLLFPGCIFYVPYSADHSILNAYQTATNWSTVASRMQEE